MNRHPCGTLDLKEGNQNNVCNRETDLERTHVYEGSEHGSEPYLWAVMVTHEHGRFSLLTTPFEQARKILRGEMVAGQSLTIPPEVNSITGAFEDKNAGTVLIFVALSEGDSSQPHATAAAMNAGAGVILQFAKDNLEAIRSTQGPRGDLLNQMIDRFSSVVRNAENADMSILERIATTLGTGGYDDPLGADLWTFSVAAPREVPIQFELSQTGESFRISGSLAVTPGPIDICRGQRDNLIAAQGHVKSLKAALARLAEELHGAHPARPKPLINAEIDRINEVKLPAAELAVSSAEAALRECLDFHVSPGGPGGPVIVTS